MGALALLEDRKLMSGDENGRGPPAHALASRGRSRFIRALASHRARLRALDRLRGAAGLLGARASKLKNAGRMSWGSA